MNLIELFYSDKVMQCLKVHSMLKKIADERKDVLLITKNIEFDECKREAVERDIPKVPTTIINGRTFIRGVPNSRSQITSKMN